MVSIDLKVSAVRGGGGGVGEKLSGLSKLSKLSYLLRVE